MNTPEAASARSFQNADATDLTCKEDVEMVSSMRVTEEVEEESKS